MSLREKTFFYLGHRRTGYFVEKWQKYRYNKKKSKNSGVKKMAAKKSGQTLEGIKDYDRVRRFLRNIRFFQPRGL